METLLQMSDLMKFPNKLNTTVKMIPGIVEHSLFYRMATKAIIAGKLGVRIINPTSERANY
jgi:ribose 5-phosphate isomerase A